MSTENYLTTMKLAVLLVLSSFHMAVTAGPPPESAWEPITELTDEFKGDKLDAKKWHDHNPKWKGRQPGFFAKKNVAVKDGKLHLTARVESLKNLPKGYHTFTTAAVKSKALVKYGYFEIKCRPMKSRASSAFWFYNNTKELWTEIDVFELSGAGDKWKRTYNMNAHVFHTPKERRHWSKKGTWKAPFVLTNAYHVYALEWDDKVIKWYVDGKVVRELKNTHWHQPLYMNFDSETMPEWFGLPDKKNLPSTFSIEYIRSWKKKNGKKPSARPNASAPKEGRAMVANNTRQPMPASAPDGQWTLQKEYSDEFNGRQLDLAKWDNDVKDWGLWSWEPENAWVKNGRLHLRMQYHRHTRQKKTLFYTSGIVRSKAAPIKYGYFEARIKAAPRHPGVCPAFWVYRNEKDLWTEIDFLELAQHVSVKHIATNTHVFKHPKLKPDKPIREHRRWQAPWDPRDGFHTYGCEWNEKKIVWYVDGKQIATRKNDYWHQALDVVISFGLRSPLNKKPSGKGFPTTFETDYVRVWKKKAAPARTDVRNGK